ncbi:MAG: SDR family oxidoreductase [Halodesulfurarchaeum sp.]
MERTALITGCSAGIGRAAATTFLEAGWNVYATARDEESIEDLEREGATISELDVTKPKQCTSVVEDAVSEHGGIDCLVNAAGYAQFGTVEDVPPSALHRQYDVNVYGPHRLIRAVLPHMRAEEDGTIVNVASGLGPLSIPGSGPVASSNAALTSLSDALRGEVGGLGIDVVVVRHGPVARQAAEQREYETHRFDRTDVYDELYDAYDDARKLRWMGEVEPETVADVILEAGTTATPDPRYTVGTVAKYAPLAIFVPERFRDTVVRMIRWLE